MTRVRIFLIAVLVSGASAVSADGNLEIIQFWKQSEYHPSELKILPPVAQMVSDAAESAFVGNYDEKDITDLTEKTLRSMVLPNVGKRIAELAEAEEKSVSMN